MDRSVWFTPTPQECRAQLRAAAELALKSIREPEPFRPRGPVLVSPRQFASWVGRDEGRHPATPLRPDPAAVVLNPRLTPASLVCDPLDVNDAPPHNLWMAYTQVVPTKAVLYTRVSTDQQAQSGLGLEAQLAACQKVAELRGLEVIGVETDMAISGKDDITRRPGLTRLLQLAGAKEDVAVIVYSLSRLSRRQRLTWDLLDDRGEHRLKVISATEPFDTSTPMGRAMLGMLAVWAQLEADMCGERTRAALQAKKAQGKRLGPPTTAQKNPETVRQIQELFASGRFPTVTALLAEVQRLGIKTNRGGRWHRTSLGRVLGQNVPDKSA